jgi:dienelactone hydrolase
VSGLSADTGFFLFREQRRATKKTFAEIALCYDRADKREANTTLPGASLPDYDAKAADLTWSRVLGFLDTIEAQA